MRRNISGLLCNARHREASWGSRRRTRAFALAGSVARGLRGSAAESGRAGVRVRSGSTARDVGRTHHRAQAVRALRRSLGAEGDARIAHDVHRAHRLVLGARERPRVRRPRRCSHGLLPPVVATTDAIDRGAIGVDTASAHPSVGARLRSALCRRPCLGLRRGRICRDRMRRFGAREEQHGQKGSRRDFEKIRTIVPARHRRDRIYGTNLRCET